MSSSSSNQEFDLTMEECERLKKAFKDEEFRKMFAEYAEEIANPENKAIYEEEIRQMEQERGMDIKFVNPEPGHVLKTVLNGSTKAFINICKNVHVGIPSHEKKDVNGKCGVSWSIPHIFAPPRDDLTKTKQNCKIFDFVIHPDTYRMSETNQRFRQMVHDLAVDGIEKMFNVTLDRKNLKQLKMKFMGHKTATVIRNKIADAKVKKQDDENDGEDPLSSFPYPYSNETSSERTQRIVKENLMKKENKNKGGSNKNNCNNNADQKAKDESNVNAVNDGFTIPKYEMKHQSDVDLKNYANEMSRVCTLSTRPDKLIMNVKLPLLSSAASIELDVFEKSMKLISTKPAKYKLEISLPYPVEENLSSAKFDKQKHELMITMPVIQASETLVSFLPSSSSSSVEENSKTNQQNLTGDTCSDESCDSKKISNYSNSNNTKASSNDTVGDRNASRSDVQTCDSGSNSSSKVTSVHSEGDVKTSDYNNAMVTNINVNNDNGDKYHYKNVHGGQRNDEEDEDDDEEEEEVDDESIKSDSTSFNDSEKLNDGEAATEATKRGTFKKENYSKNKHRLFKNDVDDGDEDNDDDGKPANIMVVHDKECPKLQGILKSRTPSESSADENVFVSKISSSNEGKDDDEEDDNNNSNSGLTSLLHDNDNKNDNNTVQNESNKTPRNSDKKSVKFNEHIDRTIYLINQSVSTLHATLKNKRKRLKKREQRRMEAMKTKEEMMMRRKRTSSGGSVSLDSNSGSEDHHHDPPLHLHHPRHHHLHQHHHDNLNCDNNNVNDKRCLDGVSKKLDINQGIVNVRENSNDTHNDNGNKNLNKKVENDNNINDGKTNNGDSNSNNNNNDNIKSSGLIGAPVHQSDPRAPHHHYHHNHHHSHLHHPYHQQYHHANHHNLQNHNVDDADDDGSFTKHHHSSEKRMKKHQKQRHQQQQHHQQLQQQQQHKIEVDVTKLIPSSSSVISSTSNSSSSLSPSSPSPPPPPLSSFSSSLSEPKLEEQHSNDFVFDDFHNDNDVNNDSLKPKAGDKSDKDDNKQSNVDDSGSNNGNDCDTKASKAFLTTATTTATTTTITTTTTIATNNNNNIDCNDDNDGNNIDSSHRKKKLIELMSSSSTSSSSSGIGSSLSSSSSPTTSPLSHLPPSSFSPSDALEKPDTILSWKDADDCASQRIVKCPIDFNNGHIFALDLD